MLQIYNSFKRHKQIFEPVNPEEIGIYVCGMTVYDYIHIGNARIFVVFDVITRYLRDRGFNVKYVRNITDIDDKIINRANENNEDIQQLTKRFIDCMHEDERILNVLPPTVEPLATEHIPQIVDMIKILMEKGYAYIGENGDVYYDVNKFNNYGLLANKEISSLRAGSRIEISEAKRDSLDFVLWKMSKPGEPSWDSSWGKGRPGWHIECSAMANQYLGKHFDIHGGGSDLLFPHHENEIAQSVAALDSKFVNTWMHVGYVQVNKRKMSKSLGNFFTVREVLKQFDGEVIRYFLIASHYRSQMNYSRDNLKSAQAALERFYLALRNLPETAEPIENSEFEQRFYEAMDDDFNTPLALAVLFDIVRVINKLQSENKLDEAGRFSTLLKKLAGILGILQQNPETFLHASISDEKKQKIENLITARTEARKNKDWKKADGIRDELNALGVEIEDSIEGTVWRLRTDLRR